MRHSSAARRVGCGDSPYATRDALQSCAFRCRILLSIAKIPFDATAHRGLSLSVALCPHNVCLLGRSALRLHQQALHFGAFVASLTQLRKQRFTQGEIAARAGLSVPTVRLVERGGGDQASRSFDELRAELPDELVASAELRGECRPADLYLLVQRVQAVSQPDVHVDHHGRDRALSASFMGTSSAIGVSITESLSNGYITII